MKVEVVADSCHGHQMCAIAAPEVFGSDELGNAIVLIVDEIPQHLVTKVRRAEANCPERAVLIKE
ncbi:MAG: ferredoxin [Ilumatobacteraceae bacterium]